MVLAIVGAIALHVIAFVSFDAVITYTPKRKIEIPPRIEMIDVSLPEPAPPKPAEPPPPSKAVEPPTPAPTPAPAKPARVASAQPKSTPAPTTNEPPPPSAPPSSASEGGHEQTYNLPEGDVAESLGKHGPKTDDRIGPRGKGSGAGPGDGSGSGAVAPIASIAAIKTLAKAKGDFSSFGDKDYPSEAKSLGIEGQIKVQLVVDETGHVKRKRLLTKLGHGLDELALARAATLLFEPALDTDGNPVTSVVVWTFDMAIPK